MKTIIKKHYVFLLILLIFLIIKIFSIFVEHDIWWDSAVYLGMGKYIYSLGNVGLWETARPIVWPLILGFLWFIKLDPILSGKILIVLFSAGILVLTYLIALEVFNKKTALLSTVFLALSQTFFLFNNILHSEIPSAFFFMLGFYFLIKKNYNLSGLFLGIAFMTRFFQIVIILPLFLIILYLFIKKKIKTKNIYAFALFFLAPIIPYLILNTILYSNPIEPFILQKFLTKYTGEVFNQPFNFYFINLIKENILVLFSVIGIIFVFTKNDYKRKTLGLAFLFGFVPYNLIAHKEMRLLIVILPFLYILTSYGIFIFINNFKRKKTLILSLILIVFLFLSTPNLKIDKYQDNLNVFIEYANDNEIKDGLWISNPSFISHSNNKANELIYYPLYRTEKIKELTNNLNNARHILINTCDITPCPQSDSFCEERHEEFISLLKENFVLKYNQINGQCEYFIFNS